MVFDGDGAQNWAQAALALWRSGLRQRCHREIPGCFQEYRFPRKGSS
jgi:hypothetical protein